MKKQLLIVSALFLGLVLSLQGQAPQSIQYQTIIRDGQGVVVMNQDVSLQFTIRQTTADGPAKYQETHTGLMTNGFGLVNLQIGTGTPTSGTFSGIDWSAGPYHLEVGLDLANGSNYTVMGTTQLLSVPYALYAGNGLPSGGSEGETLTFCDGVPIWGPCPVEVGDFVDDGIVFYLFQSGDAGYVAGEVHGLIVSLDEGTGNWCDIFSDLPGVPNVTSDPVPIPDSEPGARIGDGSSNTDGIRIGCSGGFAATWCRAKGEEWFLPSRGELNELYKWYNSDVTGINALFTTNSGTGFDNYFYWSSTEYDFDDAWVQYFNNGSQDDSDMSFSARVRAVRAF